MAGGKAGLLVERNFMVYRRLWVLIVSGFFEPVFYLFSIGIGIGTLVGTVTGADGRAVDYTVFVAPAVLATPLGPADVALGEIAWAQLRGTIYSAAFLVVMLAMGLVKSWWALLALPATVLIGFAFAAVGMATTSFMRSWQDFDFVQLAILPMFLFSTTFYPLGIYPRPLQLFVECTPLYHGIELLRALTTGAAVGVDLIGHAGYFVVMAAVGVGLSAR